MSVVLLKCDGGDDDGDGDGGNADLLAPLVGLISR